jgi:hypothetical protein
MVYKGGGVLKQSHQTVLVKQSVRRTNYNGQELATLCNDY